MCPSLQLRIRWLAGFRFIHRMSMEYFQYCLYYIAGEGSLSHTDCGLNIMTVCNVCYHQRPPISSVLSLENKYGLLQYIHRKNVCHSLELPVMYCNFKVFSVFKCTFPHSTLPLHVFDVGYIADSDNIELFSFNF